MEGLVLTPGARIALEVVDADSAHLTYICRRVREMWGGSNVVTGSDVCSYFEELDRINGGYTPPSIEAVITAVNHGFGRTHN